MSSYVSAAPDEAGQNRRGITCLGILFLVACCLNPVSFVILVGLLYYLWPVLVLVMAAVAVLNIVDKWRESQVQKPAALTEVSIRTEIKTEQEPEQAEVKRESQPLDCWISNSFETGEKRESPVINKAYP
jgi:hypothetical protein